MGLKDVLLQDFWVHLAGVIVIAFGVADLWYFRTLSHDSDLLFMIGGVAGMGLKIVNGSAAALRDAAITTALQAAQAAQMAAAATPAITTPPTSTGG